MSCYHLLFEQLWEVPCEHSWSSVGRNNGKCFVFVSTSDIQGFDSPLQKVKDLSLTPKLDLEDSGPPRSPNWARDFWGWSWGQWAGRWRWVLETLILGRHVAWGCPHTTESPGPGARALSWVWPWPRVWSWTNCLHVLEPNQGSVNVAVEIEFPKWIHFT